jgi:hypothetical protein
VNGPGHKALQFILEPLTTDEFLANSWGSAFQVIKGRRGRFAELLPWERLNEILRQHRLDFPRLRLVEGGKRVSPEKFIRHNKAGKQGISIPRLKTPEFVAALRDGATLVIDAVDELHDPLTNLAADLELFFHEKIQINTYAGWKSSKGFDLHWDDHDVFILQVTGRKRWQIYGVTRPYPFNGDLVTAQRPTTEPIWDDVLEDGDVLYMPRGWWHVAIPLNEPTVHLTVGVHNRRGLDLIKWVSQQVAARESFRSDLPRFKSKSEQRAHMRKLKEDLLSIWNDDLLETYFSEMDDAADPRAYPSLPWAGLEKPELPGPGTGVRLLAPRKLRFTFSKGTVAFSSQKKKWRFAAETFPVLRALDEKRICRVSDLQSEPGNELSMVQLQQFLGELVVQGLVAIS